MREHTHGTGPGGGGRRAAARPGRTRVTVPLPSVAYDVLVEPGALARLPALLAEHAPAARYAIIADAAVAAVPGSALAAALRAAGATVTLHTHPAGEGAKTRAGWAALSDALLEAGLGRDGCVIALGGGVTGDLAGFVAATYMRGIAWVAVPTTLLAMVDASVGGKTGVDTDAGKNLVGAFHPPRLVCADPLVLRTLPAAVLRAGLAEVLKHGAIADAAYLERTRAAAEALLAGDADALAAAIAGSVAIKARIVAADPFEQDRRAVLNFGHTLGHALERTQEYRLPHGFAVAIGMRLAARLGERLGVSEPGTEATLHAALAACSLPARLPQGTDPDALLAAARFDKKARAGSVRFVLLRRPGEVARADDAWTFPASERLVRELLEADLAAAR